LPIPVEPGHSQPDVERFLDSMWSERGLSENTLAAYRADLSGLSRWLEG
jgi:integrase/recombinase XerD